MSAPPDFTEISVFVDGANLAFQSQYGRGKVPQARWLLTVIESLRQRLPGARIGVFVDGSVWGWMTSVSDQSHMDALREMERDGALAVTPKHTTADTFLLDLARRKSGVVASNDDFGANVRQRTTRVGLPILRVTSLFDEPVWHPRFLVFESPQAVKPVQITDHEVIARASQARAADGRTAEPDPPRPDESVDAAPSRPEVSAEQTLDELQARLELIAGGSDRLDFERATTLLARPYGDDWSRVLGEVVGGPPDDRLVRLCHEHLPGWRLEGSGASRWLVRTAAPASLSLEDILAALDERVEEVGRLDINPTGAWLGGHFGPRFAEFLAAHVGGVAKGRWGRLCRTLPDWTVEEEHDRAWLVPVAPPRVATPSPPSAPPPPPAQASAVLTVDDIAAWLDEHAAGARRLDHNATGCLIGNAFGEGWRVFLDEVVGKSKKGRWVRLCDGLLPGWRLEVDREGTRWLVRTLAGPPSQSVANEGGGRGLPRR